jgi:hypothetical protein
MGEPTHAENVQCPKWWCRRRFGWIDEPRFRMSPGQRLTLHLATWHPKLLAKRRRALRGNAESVSPQASREGKGLRSNTEPQGDGSPTPAADWSTVDPQTDPIHHENVGPFRPTLKAGPRDSQWQPCPEDSSHMAEWHPYSQDFPDGWYVHCRMCGAEGYRRAVFGDPPIDRDANA